jgi:hypothetical protein
LCFHIIPPIAFLSRLEKVATLVGLGPVLDTARFLLTADAFCPFVICVAFASGTHFGYFLFDPLLLPQG